MGEWVGEITLVREDVQDCWILHSSQAFHPAPAETETRWPMSVFVAALPLTFFGLMHVFSLWHQPQLHLGHLMFPLRSDCAILVSCGKEPGHVPRKGWGVGCCWPWNPMGWSSLQLPPRNKRNKDLWQSQQNSHQLWALARLRKVNIPSRLALAPALESKCSQRGLWVCTCCSVPWDLPAQLVPCSAVLPDLCTFKRGQVWSVGFLS